MTGISITAHRHYCDFAGPLDTLLVAGGTGAETTRDHYFSDLYAFSPGALLSAICERWKRLPEAPRPAG